MEYGGSEAASNLSVVCRRWNLHGGCSGGSIRYGNAFAFFSPWASAGCLCFLCALVHIPECILPRVIYPTAKCVVHDVM